MLAFDLPDATAAKRVTAHALERGLIVLTCGRNADAVRMLPPLTIEDEVLAEGLDLLESALKRSHTAF
jgi:4-aminobutyrate aminotransferase-like enzyme